MRSFQAHVEFFGQHSNMGFKAKTAVAARNPMNLEAVLGEVGPTQSGVTAGWSWPVTRPEEREHSRVHVRLVLVGGSDIRFPDSLQCGGEQLGISQTVGYFRLVSVLVSAEP